MLGQLQFVQQVEHKIWWNGEGYAYVEPVALYVALEDMPLERPFGEIRSLRAYIQAENKYIWVEHYFDSIHEEWVPLEWLWEIDGFNNVPMPGLRLGAAHVVIERCVPYHWNGYQWTRLKHSHLSNDEPERHLPAGFLQDVEGSLAGMTGNIADLTVDLQATIGEVGRHSRFFNPDARLIFISPLELRLSGFSGATGYVNVAGEWIAAANTVNVLNTTPAIAWNEVTSTLSQVDVQPDVWYWVYLANHLSPAFNFATHDYRGKLFLSTQPDQDGYLGVVAPAENARLVGQVKMDANGQFIRNLNLSLISRLSNFSETYRDYSDYQIQYIDSNELRMEILYGLYGQIAIADYLYYLGGTAPTIRATGESSGRLVWSESAPENLEVDTTNIVADTLYWIYIGADIDTLNFNAVNPDTGRPWQITDTGAVENYDENLDYRLRPFLSLKVPESGVMSQEWPGPMIRHIGRVKTDNLGLFQNSFDLSEIQPFRMNPSYFSGYAECALVIASEQEFRVIARKGSSGIVMVGGRPVQLHDQYSPDVHYVSVLQMRQVYNETTPDNPLTSEGLPVYYYYTQPKYVYLANDRPFWGEWASKLFVTSSPPVQGYLSQNWPGNQARWIATLKLPFSTKITTGVFVDSLMPTQLRIDDTNATLNTTISGAKFQAEVTAIWAAISAGNAYAAQQSTGCGIRLEYSNISTLVINPVTTNVTIVFPNMATRTISAPITLNPTGEPGTMYYVWVRVASVVVNTTPPDQTLGKLSVDTVNNGVLAGYFCFAATNAFQGPNNVFSRAHEPVREWSGVYGIGTLVLDVPFAAGGGNHNVTYNAEIPFYGLLIPPNITGNAARSSPASAWNASAVDYGTCIWAASNNVALGSCGGSYSVCTMTAQVWLDPGATLSTGIYNTIKLCTRLDTDINHPLANYHYYQQLSTAGGLLVTRPGS